MWISNDLGASWQLSTGNAGWAAREGMAAVSIGGTIIVMGGFGECINVVCGETYASILINIYIMFIQVVFFSMMCG